MTLLLMDTSTERGVLGLVGEKGLIWQRELPIGFQTAQNLLPLLQKGINDKVFSLKDLKGIGVGIGPGSYTGIRVGVVLAKTLAYALNIPLIGISSLELFDYEGSHAVAIDAKIGGMYLSVDHGSPFLCPLAEAVTHLGGIDVIVTPRAEALRLRLSGMFPDKSWEWIEASPSLTRFGSLVQNAWAEGKGRDSQNLEILYLRKTQAEMERDG